MAPTRCARASLLPQTARTGRPASAAAPSRGRRAPSPSPSAARHRAPNRPAPPPRACHMSCGGGHCGGHHDKATRCSASCEWTHDCARWLLRPLWSTANRTSLAKFLRAEPCLTASQWGGSADAPLVRRRHGGQRSGGLAGVLVQQRDAASPPNVPHSHLQAHISWKCGFCNRGCLAGVMARSATHAWARCAPRQTAGTTDHLT